MKIDKDVIYVVKIDKDVIQFDNGQTGVLYTLIGVIKDRDRRHFFLPASTA